MYSYFYVFLLLCVYILIVTFVPFWVVLGFVFVHTCSVLLPPGFNPIAFKKYIIYHNSPGDKPEYRSLISAALKYRPYLSYYITVFYTLAY